MFIFKRLIDDDKHGGQPVILVDRKEIDGSIVDTEIKTEDDKRVYFIAVIQE